MSFSSKLSEKYASNFSIQSLLIYGARSEHWIQGYCRLFSWQKRSNLAFFIWIWLNESFRQLVFTTSDKLTWRRFLAIGFIQRVKIPFWKLRWTFTDRFSSTKNHRGFPQRRVTADLKVNFNLKHSKKHFDHLKYSVWMAFTFTLWLLCCEVLHDKIDWKPWTTCKFFWKYF